LRKRPAALKAQQKMPEFETFQNIKEIRHGLTLLDFIFPHSKQDHKTGLWHSLSDIDLKTIYTGRKRHMEEHIKTLEWHEKRNQVLSHRLRTYAGFVHREIGYPGESGP